MRIYRCSRCLFISLILVFSVLEVVKTDLF